MKSLMMTLLAVGSFLMCSANTFYDQLIAFNPNWAKYDDCAPAGGERAFDTDFNYVAAHLEQVLHILRCNPTDHLSEEQLQARQQNIAILDDYRQQHCFPMNYYRKERIPVFIDEHDTHCAVGYLLQQNGLDHIARRIAAANNYAWVKEIDDPALPAWQKASGFTLEEIKLIQGAYDFYPEFSLFAPNRIELPQKPVAETRFFEEDNSERGLHVWFTGQGSNGVLNGKWVQYAAPGVPWIVGYFKNGKRTGQWMEYYHGTQQLCRTEHWEKDELHGVRKRWDREGKFIEEIHFIEGEAVTKVNFDYENNIKWVRKPLKDNLVYSEAYTLDNKLIAEGHELVDNPSNLQWFQNIELTALNTFALDARDLQQGRRHYNTNSNAGFSSFASSVVNNERQLVNYNKDGEWLYHLDATLPAGYDETCSNWQQVFEQQYAFMAPHLNEVVQLYGEMPDLSAVKTLAVSYAASIPQRIDGFADGSFLSVAFLRAQSRRAQEQLKEIAILPAVAITSQVSIHRMFNPYNLPTLPRAVEFVRRYDANGDRIGVWKSYDAYGTTQLVLNYLQPTAEGSPVLELAQGTADKPKRIGLPKP